MSKADRNRQAARARIAQLRAEEARRARRRKLMMIIGGGVLAVIAVVAIVLAVSTGGKAPAAQNPSTPKLKLTSLRSLGTLSPAPAAGSNGFEGVPIPNAQPLASAATSATGGAVDGIHCNTNEQLLFHIHAHLTIFVNGSPRQVPAGIGIPGAVFQNTAQGPAVGSGTCFYWLHTHAADGIIHIESPVHRTFTLGNFFDEWGQPLGPDKLGAVSGHVVAIYNGRLYEGNPRDIPLNAHAQIQLEIGRPLVAPERITFPNGL